jgi:hypothetical protein
MAAGSTYTKIASTTLGTAAASVTFSSIPSTYTDLILITNGSTSINGSTKFQLNGDTASNYSFTQLFGTGTSAASARNSSQTSGLIGSTTVGSNATQITQFLNYSNTTTNKTILVRANEVQSDVNATVNLYRSTAAISSIVFTSSGGGNFIIGSTFNLYGIAAA